MPPVPNSPGGRLLVRGSINIDEFFVVPHIVSSGETISSTSFTRRGGGKGANQAVAVAKAGGAVDFAGWIGDDGEWMKTLLSSYVVGTELLLTDSSLPTGRAIIQLSTATHDNSIVLLPGANFSPRPLPLPSRPYALLLLQNEIPLATTSSFLALGKAAGMTTMFNPSPMLSEEEIRAFEWEKVDWLLVNEGEGDALLSVLGEKGDGELLERLRSVPRLNGCGIILTLGSEGVAASWGGEVLSCPAGRVSGGVVDTTGAGDCFTGYLGALFATRYPKTMEDLRAALEVASQAAAMCVESEGAMESVPTLASVRKRMGEVWPETHAFLVESP